MGQSTDAILFYGYCWDDERSSIFNEDKDEDSDNEWVEIIAKRRGIPSPWGFYRSSGAEALHRALPYKEQSEAFRAWEREVDFDALLEAWNSELAKIRDEYDGVHVGSHCSCEYPMPFIYMRDSHLRASRGYAQVVDPAHIAPNFDGWNKSLTKFVTDLNIDISEAKGPGWFLVSMWC